MYSGKPEGFLIRVNTVGYSSQNTSGRNTKEQVADALNTRGLYSIVRHPLYLGNFFMWFGIAMFTSAIWFMVCFCLLFWIYYERIMFAEEEYLRKKFGEPYLKWAENTPLFIPQFTKWKRPQGSFDYSKVLKNEKSGFLALFSAFFLLEFSFSVFRNHSLNLKEMFWLYAFLFALILYMIIKIKEKL